jgi:hypothetical protein
MPVEGGEEELVFDRLPAGAAGVWALTDHGIYFGESAKPSEVVEFYSFATRRVTPIATSPWIQGVAVSPDARWLLYAQRDGEHRNIMLVENFR